MIAAALVLTAMLAGGAVWVGVSYAGSPKLGDATPGAGGWTRDRSPTLAIDV